MKTFSVVNDLPGINEQDFMDDVNQHCESQSIKHYLTEDAATNEFSEFIYHQDEPVFSLSQYAEFCVMRLAKENGVTVLLNGQGGDEALCGYRKYAFFHLRQLVLRWKFVRAVQHLGSSLLHGDRQLLNFWQGARYAPGWLRRYYDLVDDVVMPRWQHLRRAAWKSRMAGVVGLHAHQWADLQHWSLPVLLRYQDRNSMAHSVEGRVPLVDHRLIEHTLTLPEEYFFRGGMTKRVLVDSLGTSLTESVRTRRTKLGFDTPQAIWLKGPFGNQLEHQVRTCQRLQEIVDGQTAGDAFVAYRSGSTRIPHFMLFRMACLATWLDRFEVDPGAD